MKKDKLLFVIPAYNEEKNIEKVIYDLKENVDYADILIINDCSKDNTEKIIKESNIDYINMPFNVGYSCAVQTGLKYAYENNYDYVIQFDADGQHIAKEAEKLYTHMKKNNCDIVIGSRYLKNKNVKYSICRKLGTKIFSCLIKLFCKKSITDPLSGFQCLNRNVIKEYSKFCGYPEYPDANLIIEMLYKGYKIEEIPVKMKQRKAGKSMHFGIIKPVKYMAKMIYITLFIMIRYLNFKEERK